jgi:two-component system sensor histidine kinase KdpD
MTVHIAGTDERPSPEAFLAEAVKEKRGRLKVFLGAAPGVGKTYAMLQAARRRKADGVDVIVGLVETHGRSETTALLDGLEALPRIQIQYRGHTVEEFDLDAALARHPQLLLVDELAHTNAPGSRHPKRYLDVQELLKAGIDVYTTLNIQHLESLNDIVARITRIRVRETLPDSALELADEIELIDLTPEALIQRLHEGKVYVPHQAARAVANYFKPGNLTALRELALRRTAERVDEQMVDYMRRHAIAGPWPAGERIMVCVSEHPNAPRLVRAARRLADMLGAKWGAVYVEMPRYHRLDEAARDRIAAVLRLAERLGGEAVVLPGRDLPEELLRYAHTNNITQIVIGKSHRSRLVELFRRSLVHELLRRSGSIAVHILAGDAETEIKVAAPATVQPWLALEPFVGSAAAVGIAGLVAKLIHSYVALPNISMIFLVAVLISAVRWGPVPSIFASLLSAAIYNFFFIEPIYTFTIARSHEILAFVTYLLVAILTGNLTGRIRDQAIGARRRSEITQALYDFSRKLAATTKIDDLLWAIVYQVAQTMKAETVVLLPEDGDRLVLQAGYPPIDELGTAEWAAARWAWTHGEAAGRGSETLPNAAWYFLPMKTVQGTVGVLGLQFASKSSALAPDQRRLLDALLDQAAVAIERANLERSMREARVYAETEKLRAALLSSVSHDLRTPLASIIGSITSLLSYGGAYSEPVRRDLMLTVQEEAERLNRFVGNLLDMTKLESGALEIKRDWVEIGELVGAAVERVRRHLGQRRIKLELADRLPMVRVDFVLFEQVLFNLLDNATKYSPSDSTVRLVAERAGGDVIIEVIDEGPGIPADDLERVFDKFHRVRRGDRQTVGTGLGLSICRGIAEAHGGSITARSPVAGGRGTAMTIRLPVEAQPVLYSPEAAAAP